MLEAAGVKVAAEQPHVDERAVEQAIGSENIDGETIASILAEAKAADVSERNPEALVIGSDQVLSLDHRIIHKPATMEEARRNLLALSGKTHLLISAVVVSQNGEAIWRHAEIARLKMRDLEPGYIGRYLASVGEEAMKSVGSYQIEKKGVNLFEKIDGDYFTIMGLPLLPLLAELRRLEAIDG